MKFNMKCLWARLNIITGQIWAAGPMFDTPDLDQPVFKHRL